MFQKLPNQSRISILLVKISEVEATSEYTDEDKGTMIRFYRKKIRDFSSIPKK